MSVGRYTEKQFGERLRHYLRPAAPVTAHDMLHGRDKQLEVIRRSLFANGRSVFIYGERGVGKSSLARVVARQYRGDTEDFLYVQCEASSTLSSVLLALARAAQVEERSPQERKHTITARLGKFFEYQHTRSSHRPEVQLVEPPSLDACVELVNDIVDAVGEYAIAVIDEFDTISELSERQRFGDLLKRLGDQDIDFKIVLSGIASSLDDLLGGHPSSIRQLHTEHLERLSWDARMEIIQAAADGVGVSIERGLCIRIAAISGGFPSYAHMLTEKLLWQMFSDPLPVTEATASHFRAALEDAVEAVSPHLKGPYHKATQRRSDDYRDAIWAAADAYDLQRNTSKIFDSYLTICAALGKPPLDRRKFLARLSELKKPAYGSILKNLADRSGWYEFNENLVRGYVRLVAEQQGVELNDQSVDAPKQLTARVKNISPRQAYRAPLVPNVRFRGEQTGDDEES